MDAFLPQEFLDGGQVSGKEIRWDVALNAGESKTVSYDCTVTAKRGETITFANGKAAEIPSNSIRIPVGGKHLTDAENAILADIPNGTYRPQYRGLMKTDFATTVWQNILKQSVLWTGGKTTSCCFLSVFPPSARMNGLTR